MSVKVNYFGIGLFVLAALALSILGLLFWGADTFNRQKYFMETYFDESVQGLNIGSPVYYRGVQIGSVYDIGFAAMHYPEIDQQANFSKYVRVVIAEAPRRSHSSNHPTITVLSDKAKQGLRLRLTSQPLTGVAYIEADYVDPELYPEPVIAWEPSYTYIPSAPSLLNKLTQTAETAFKRLSEMDINGLLKKADLLLSNLNQVVQDAQIKTISTEVITAVQGVTELSRQARGYLTPAGPQAEPRVTLEDVLVTLDTMLKSVETEVKEARVEEVSAELTGLIKDLRQTSQKLQAVIQSSPDTPASSVEQTLVAIEGASDALRQTVQRTDPELRDLIENLIQLSGELKAFLEDLRDHPSRAIFSQPPTPTELLP